MKLTHYAKLNLPFEFIPIDPCHDMVKSNLCRYDDKQHPEVLDFLNSLGLESIRVGALQFSVPAGKDIVVHADGREFSHLTKLNFVFGGYNNQTVWHHGGEHNVVRKTTPTNEPYIAPQDLSLLKEASRASVDGACLFDAGVFHSLTNPSEYLYCVSFSLWDTQTNSNLQWDKALDIFAPWLHC